MMPGSRLGSGGVPASHEDPITSMSSGGYADERSTLQLVDRRQHPDYWPCFVLGDATVYRGDGSPISLLHSELDGPFTIGGRLEVDSDLYHLRKEPQESTLIATY
jgi:hypothetical protein